MGGSVYLIDIGTGPEYPTMLFTLATSVDHLALFYELSRRV